MGNTTLYKDNPLFDDFRPGSGRGTCRRVLALDDGTVVGIASIGLSILLGRLLVVGGRVRVGRLRAGRVVIATAVVRRAGWEVTGLVLVGEGMVLVGLGDGDDLLLVVVDAGLVEVDGRVGDGGVVVVRGGVRLDDGVLSGRGAHLGGVLDVGLGVVAMLLVHRVGGGDGGRVGNVGYDTAVLDWLAGRDLGEGVGGDGGFLGDSHVVAVDGVDAWSIVRSDLGNRCTVRVRVIVRAALAIVAFLDLHGLVVGPFFAMALLAAKARALVTRKADSTEMVIRCLAGLLVVFVPDRWSGIG